MTIPNSAFALRGMTWAHPRGLDPLVHNARLDETDPNAVDVTWEAQSLAGFESRPLRELAEQFDLLVLDHPGLGAASSQGHLLALDGLVPPEELSHWRDGFVGGSTQSYFYNGHQWAVPIDAATQVTARREDLLSFSSRTWADVLQVATQTSVVVPTLAPHALLTFLGVAAAIDPSARPTPNMLVPKAAAIKAITVLARLVRGMRASHLGLDPIEVLDRMRDTDEIALCPLVYSYVTYAGEQSGNRKSIRFENAPSWNRFGPPGSVLGGTGLAISAHSVYPDLALRALRRISGPRAQRDEGWTVGGQPADVVAWTDPAINARWGDFYLGTLATQLTAWRRPRFDGWITFQQDGSLLLMDGILQSRSNLSILDDLHDLYRNSLIAGPL